MRKPSQTCRVPRCPLTAQRGEMHCSQHKHEAALQAEIERMAMLVPTNLRTLKAQFGPGLENLLAALHKLVFYADPQRGRNIDSDRPSAGLPDKWAGTSQLAERGDLVTHKGAADSMGFRISMPYWKGELGRMAERIEEELNPIKTRTRPPKRRCSNPDCKGKQRSQAASFAFCGYCGQSMEEAAA